MIPFLKARSPESRKLIRTIEFEYALYSDFNKYDWTLRHVWEPLFKETCVYLARYLELKNLTLHVWTLGFNIYSSRAGKELVKRKYLASLRADLDYASGSRRAQSGCSMCYGLGEGYGRCGESYQNVFGICDAGNKQDSPPTRSGAVGCRGEVGR